MANISFTYIGFNTQTADRITAHMPQCQYTQRVVRKKDLQTSAINSLINKRMIFLRLLEVVHAFFFFFFHYNHILFLELLDTI